MQLWFAFNARKALLLGITCLSAHAAAGAETAYSFSVLPTQGLSSYEALRMNDKGQVVGTIRTLDQPNRSVAAIWDAAGVTPLPSVAGSSGSEAYGMNNFGQVVGRAIVGGPYVPVLWSGGTGRRLDMGTGSGGFANAINDAGTIVGELYFGDPGFTIGPRPASWSAATGARTDLLPLPLNGHRDASASAINQAGVIAGVNGSRGSSHSPPSVVPMTWSGGPRSYGSDYRRDTAVYDINEQGVYVGGSGSTDSLERPPTAFMGSVDGGAPQELGSLLWRSTARAVNNAGVIVGSSRSLGLAESLATLWRDGQMVDMNGLLDPVFAASGWTLTGANDINEAGLVLADARHFSGDRGLFILTPVPEPTTFALMLLGVVGVLASTGGRPASRFTARAPLQLEHIKPQLR